MGKDSLRLWFKGGLIGIFVPIILGGIVLLLISLKIPLGENPITPIFVIALCLLELPTVIVGRGLGLPIENGGAAFLLYDFSALGYILTIIIWALIGALIGLCLDMANEKRKRTRQVPKY